MQYIEPEKLLYLPGKVWVFWKDLEGRYLKCNSFMAESLGLLNEKEIEDKTDFEIGVKKEESLYYRTQDQLVINTNLPLQFEDTATLREKKLQFLVTKLPLIERKKVKGIIGISYISNISSLDFSSPLDRLATQNKTTIPNQINTDSCLSHREIECVKWVVKGKTAKHVGKILHLSHRTVEDYLKNIKFKLKVSSKSELIEKILEQYPYLLI